MTNIALIPDAATKIPPLEAFVDGFPETTHVLTVSKAEEPLEDGSLIADHAVSLPHKLRLTGWASDIRGQGRTIFAWDAIRRLIDAREPLTVITALGEYPDMLIQKVEGEQGGHGCRFEMTLERIIRVGDLAGDLAPGTTSGPASERPGAVSRGRIQVK